MQQLKVKLLSATAKAPTRAHRYDAGLDLRCDGEVWLMPGREPMLVGTGVAIELLPGYQATILPKSGLSSRGVHVYPGTIDASYTGELKVCMQLLLDPSENGGQLFRAGDKIAQLVVTRVELPDVVVVDELTQWGTRGTAGFGSSGWR